MSRESMHPGSEALETYAEGAMEDADRAVLESHLMSCVRCQGEVEEWRSLFATLEILPRFAPSSGFAERVMARVRVPDPSAAWRTQVLAQVAAAGQRVGHWLPRTTRGWAFVTALLAIPALIGGGLIVWLLTRSYVSADALWIAAVSTVDNGAQRLGSSLVSSAMQSSIATWLAANVGAFLETAGMRGLGIAIALASLLTVLSIYVLYRNLFRTPTRESSYVTYSF